MSTVTAAAPRTPTAAAPFPSTAAAQAAVAAITTSTINVASILQETAARMPGNIAVVIDDESTSYADLWRQCRSYAGALRARGIGPGRRVAMLVPNSPDFPRVYYAVLALGATVVPVHSQLKAKEIEYLLRDSGADLLVCAGSLLDEGSTGAMLAEVDILTVAAPDGHSRSSARLEDEAAVAEPLDTVVPTAPLSCATILYTSGTTGTPKGAMSSHFSLVEQASVMLLSTFDMTASDRVLGALPLFHTFGQACTMNAVFRAGATLVLVPRFDGVTALATMVRERCTLLMGVPTMYFALLEAAALTSARPPLRYAISGGAALPLAVIDRFRDAFAIEIHESYGCTEMSPGIAFNHRGRPTRHGTVGTAMWGVEICIADPDAADAIIPLAVGDLGEIVVRGSSLMVGYLNRPEATAASIVDGWFRTGDLGRLDDDGYLTIVDRTKDMIVRNGYNVYPREVEEVLAGHPDVSMSAVFGVPHERHGEEIVATVVLVAGAVSTPQQLIDFVRREIAAYKYPRQLEIVESLPLGASGKVLKRELQTAWQHAH